MKKVIRIAGLILLLLVLIVGGMIYSLARGLSEGAALEIGEVDLTAVADGTYRGHYEGGRWSNTVAVTVKNNQITAIELIEDMRFVQEGVTEKVFDAVIRNQGTAIDTISQATVSSKAYLKAIENALGQGEASTPAPQEPSAELPSPIAAWLENSLPLFIGQSYSYEGMLYILVTYGEKPTGGYSVDITDHSIDEEQIKITAYFREPADDEMVTEAITYPYDLLIIEETGQAVIFIAGGAETYLPTLYGLDYLRPIVARSQWIKIFSPVPDERVAEQFTVEGIANVFEGTVNYSLSRGDDKLGEGFITAMMGDWGYFSLEFNVAEQVAAGDKMLLELYTISPKDGSLENIVEIKLEAK